MDCLRRDQLPQIEITIKLTSNYITDHTSHHMLMCLFVLQEPPVQPPLFSPSVQPPIPPTASSDVGKGIVAVDFLFLSCP